MKWLCEGHIGTRTVLYNRPCMECTGYAPTNEEAAR